MAYFFLAGKKGAGGVCISGGSKEMGTNKIWDGGTFSIGKEAAGTGQMVRGNCRGCMDAEE